ncbi:MAG: hypothetical protein LV471_00540 [Nitrosomonas sp.]|nr:hypothetical protein [Nitrosomonas sp.]
MHLFFTTAAAQAHAMDGPNDGCQHGFIHPLSGLESFARYAIRIAIALSGGVMHDWHTG